MVERNNKNSFRSNGMMPKLIGGRNQSAALLLFLLVITTMFSGCVEDKTLEIVQSAIDSLNRQPGMWEETMKNTIDELGRVGTESAKEVLADVQSTYNGALGQTESTAFCGADFIGRRVEQRMEAILHKLDKNTPEPKIVPVICSTNPSDHIDARDPGKTLLVTYYGYDFLNFSKNHTFTANLQYGSGEMIRQNFGYVRIPHNYELVLDIQAADYSNVDRTLGPAVVLRWGDQTVEGEGVKSELPVLLPIPTPPPPEKVTYSIAVRTGDFDKAGTNANVYITLFGTKGETPERHLYNSKNNRDPFERAKTDYFDITNEDIGDLTKIQIKRDDYGEDSGWYLDHIYVTNTNNNGMWIFEYDRWIDKNKAIDAPVS